MISKLTRLYPLMSGLTRISNSDFLDRISGRPRGEAWARVAGGDLLISHSDFVGRAAFYLGDLDRKISAVVDRCLRPGDVALDVGANIGLVTLRMAKRVGPLGRVHAFEPNPKVLRSLRATLVRNGIVNVTVHDYALGQVPDVLPLHIPADNAGAGTLLDRGNQGSSALHMVPVRVLDDVPDIDFSRASLMKMDVEGFERQVLVGLSRTLERAPPAAIVLERNELGEDGAPDNRALNLLSDAGYTIYGIKKSLVRLRLTASNAVLDPTIHDFLALARTARGNEIRSRLRL